MYEIEQPDLDIIEEHVANNKLVNAIRHFRSVTGTVIKESKEEIDYYNYYGKWSDNVVVKGKTIGDLSKYPELPKLKDTLSKSVTPLKTILCNVIHCPSGTCENCPVGDKAPEEDAIAYLLHILDEDK